MMAVNWRNLLQENRDLFFNIHNDDIKEGKSFLGAAANTEKTEMVKEHVFEYYISDINAQLVYEKTIKLRMVNEKDLNLMEVEIIDLLKSILEDGQNPIEMFLYCTKALNLSDKNVYQSILRILVSVCNLSKAGRDALISVLKNWTWDLQMKIAIEAIRTIKEKSAFDVLLMLLNDESLKVLAADCLIDIGDERCIRPVLNMVNTFNGFSVNERNVAFRLIDKLSHFGEEALSEIIKCYMNNENKSLNTVYSNVISRSKDMAIESLSKMLYNEDYNQKAAITLGKMRIGSATDCLIEALNSPLIENKMNIIIGLGYTKDKKSIKYLVNMLNDENLNSEIKACIITSLANLEAFEAKDIIKKYIDDKELRINTMSALVQLGEMRYLGGLFEYLISSNKSHSDTLCAIKELKRLKGFKDSRISKEITNGIKYLIRNDDGYACLNALRILDANIDDGMAEELILKLKTTKKEEIQYTIYKILGKNTGILSNVINERIFIDASLNESTRIRYLAQKIIEKNYKGRDKLIKA
ncbi:HEAT repeat domain-containing protein [Thermoanaerobacterium sp. CMT5567-10]|uniref:HEAT repeat domain-containing protein n=1 Tax=Thermoanaerobacterium sp. CMT5567-10 TaxID=3061989 RepID=UPI0026DEF413|nr:HEAT repeat domain-containing protein [Thermoanaerobacterium sp. CMT5567-10]